jgi:hypothetical protein
MSKVAVCDERGTAILPVCKNNPGVCGIATPQESTTSVRALDTGSSENGKTRIPESAVQTVRNAILRGWTESILHA